VTYAVNIPNQLTLARLVLAIVFVVVLSMFSAEAWPANRGLLQAGFWIFLTAAITDILDGKLARLWGQVTSFGRIVDPFVDKVIVCGAFLLFASQQFYDPATGRNLTGVTPWMAIIILSRELLVSALRAHSEASGQDFAAMWLGKLKMFIQSFTACAVLGTLGFAFLEPLRIVATISVWVTVIVTTLSMITYLQRARDFLFSARALGASSVSRDAPLSPHPPRPPAEANA